MNMMVVAVFDTETAALEGLKAVSDLHSEGGISLYASAVIVKDKTGKVSVRKPAEKGPIGTALGFLTGGLIGILGGPAGIAMGTSFGGLTGALLDLERAGVNLAFLHNIAETLAPGKAAVLAEVEESWPSGLLDSRLRAPGGTVFRTFRADVIEDQLVRKGAAIEADLKSLDEELKHVTSSDRAALQRGIDEAKTQLKSSQDQAKAELDQIRSETEAKVKALQDQAKGLSDRAKTRIEKRIADLRTDFDVRSDKLKQAWALTKTALTP